jgi:hypothetical protein
MSNDDDLDPDIKAHSERLVRLIQDQIASNGGALPFWRFMELALYAPGLGYYSAGATKLGPDGDFVTAPELGPVFAECVADALAPVLNQIGDEAVFMAMRFLSPARICANASASDCVRVWRRRSSRAWNGCRRRSTRAGTAWSSRTK